MQDTISSIQYSRHGQAGHITLDRPKNLNAIDRAMAEAIMEALAQWQDDPSVQRILIDSSSSKAFCAGGDIKSLYRTIQDEGPKAAHTNMVIPYQAMQMIADYPKPIITLMDGITMGGGIGLGAHARYRVVTERSVLAMPENLIGLTPDAGGSWLLAQAPRPYGLRLALTGGRMAGAQAVTMGFADYLVSSEKLEALKAALLSDTAPEDVILQRYAATDLTPLADAFPRTISTVYDVEDMGPHEGLPVLLSRLEASDEDWAKTDLTTLRSLCPFSLHVTWRMQQKLHATHASCDDAFALETQLVLHMISRPDFSEGVRARVIDKDNAPRWSPATLSEVKEDAVEHCFKVQ
ncbi:3-hydroxyisobutyryl-CoA hydrolase [Acetobacter aceti NRIC 0242]|uniref:3-hydroxyisobutyryl-CoA hydrolase n=1 Tax=Acetobacter aceti NBRC 14818 TaxID=887700 RepID=A0AB33I7L3_ACEAC|nr:enoyl-CoA hydratase/isomerase family protein [Acetobacter aceti]TCS34925.1 enoyl-CoA hydratase [Acetobacter aceti NBRC 14818]BCK74496.1 enoyl-CoA hydratase [Acetobacter aceti NBRC 14818]GAN56005.1 3-hydroxyisobutyryl-CoA hydrolase/enoyl-CoA hydratase [Acetobacter aceti NBRC 14818]GBO80154.1 3-hydroxyisobutyryl-CoA hydrolase [Acetobacter aceti NRIC 0242]